MAEMMHEGLVDIHGAIKEMIESTIPGTVSAADIGKGLVFLKVEDPQAYDDMIRQLIEADRISAEGEII